MTKRLPGSTMSRKERLQFCNRIENLLSDLGTRSARVDRLEGETSPLAYLLNDTLVHLRAAVESIQGFEVTATLAE